MLESTRARGCQVRSQPADAKEQLRVRRQFANSRDRGVRRHPSRVREGNRRLHTANEQHPVDAGQVGTWDGAWRNAIQDE